MRGGERLWARWGWGEGADTVPALTLLSTRGRTDKFVVRGEPWLPTALAGKSRGWGVGVGRGLLGEGLGEASAHSSTYPSPPSILSPSIQLSVHSSIRLSIHPPSIHYSSNIHQPVYPFIRSPSYPPHLPSIPIPHPSSSQPSSIHVSSTVLRLPAYASPSPQPSGEHASRASVQGSVLAPVGPDVLEPHRCREDRQLLGVVN